MINPIDPNTIHAIDININEIRDTKTAYIRISPELRDFFARCKDLGQIVGFEYTHGELNFGVIIKETGYR